MRPASLVYTSIMMMQRDKVQISTFSAAFASLWMLRFFVHIVILFSIFIDPMPLM